MRISTLVDGAGNVTQETDVFGDIRVRFYELTRLHLDDGIRQGLIRLGWTPPRSTLAAETGGTG